MPKPHRDSSEQPVTVLFRVDASDTIGSGHVMRCLALAQLFRAHGSHCLFALRQCPPQLLERLRADGCEIHILDDDDLDALCRLAEARQPAAVVLDGYHFTPEYRQALFNCAAHVLAIDDAIDDAPLFAHAVLNSSPLASQVDYRTRAPQATLLLGPAYAPLREEFLSRRSRPEPSACDHLLLTFGGGDILNVGPQLIPTLMPRLPEGMQVDWVLGGTAPDQTLLDELCGRWPNLVPHLNVSDMSSLMSRSCAAVFAAGSTLLELAYMGVPGIAVVVADNQAPALQPPYTAWFEVFDLRNSPAAIERVTGATLALLGDTSAREAHRRQLLELDVASQTATIPQRLFSA